MSEDAAITIYRRMEAACAGARAERDIMRTAIERIAQGDPDPKAVAVAALKRDLDRRQANLVALIGCPARSAHHLIPAGRGCSCCSYRAPAPTQGAES